MRLTIKVVDDTGNVICQRSGENFVDICCNREYVPGDKIILESSEKNVYLHWQPDDALGSALVYLTDDEVYDIPFGEKRVCHSPKIFSGNRHYIYAEAATVDEIQAYQNLALNPTDQHKDVNCYPHATANVETRGESVFAAKNAIDGVRANWAHGNWPYASWGINRREDAAICIDFGRTIQTDKIVLYLRADFPHDNWWVQGTFHFSDGTSMTFPLEKTPLGQSISFPAKEIQWLELSELIKADDPSPFPALTQIQVWGWNK